MSETFAAGDKVFLIHLQEEAEVIKLSGSEMVFVKVDGMEIPVYCSDITKNIPERKSEKKEERNEKKIQQPVKEDEKKEQLIKSDSGIFISFEPVKDKSGEVKKFRVSLVNDTVFPISFRYSLSLAGAVNFQLEKIALPYQIFLLHEVEYDSLNEMPGIDLQVRDVMSSNLEGKLNQKIKPQNFFNKIGRMPLSSNEAYVYKVNVIKLVKKEEKKDTQKKVTFDPEVLKQMMMEVPSNKDANVTDAMNEVDLHLEALTKNHQAIDREEVIHFQLAKFQQALDRALGSGLDRFYVIHGVGSGKLKKEIHHLLKNYKEVKSFNNDYHPRYGYGATEIILR